MTIYSVLALLERLGCRQQGLCALYVGPFAGRQTWLHGVLALLVRNDAGSKACVL